MFIDLHVKYPLFLPDINRLTPNDPYMGHTTPLTSKRCISYIYSTNRGSEYFKHALYSLFFSSSKCSLFHNANLFVSCIIHILYTGCAKIKKNNSGAKGLTNLMYKFLFYNKFIICLYTFRALFAHHQVVKLCYTASGIVTPVGGCPVHRLREELCTGRPPTQCDDTRCCIIQFCPPDDEHKVLETCRGIQ